MDYIRSYYRVPAKRGGRVIYHDGPTDRSGVITSALGALGQYLRIRLDGRARSDIFHPTWGITYL